MKERERIRAGYRDFAAREATGRSPLYAELAAGVAEDDELLEWLADLPVGKRQPNLMFAAARTIGGTPSGFGELRGLLAERRDEVEDVLRTRRTQTNEPARCATLLPLLATLPQPLALLEVGASAGLCLLPDRYSYEFVVAGEAASDGAAQDARAAGNGAGGDRRADAVGTAGTTGTAERIVRLGDEGPTLRCRLAGPVPIPTRLPEVVWRAGLDLEPVDVRDRAQTAWLEALVWPGEGDRLNTLRAALKTAREDPPRVVRGDLTGDDLAELASHAPTDATLVIFHTAVLMYIPREAREAFGATVRRLPATWIANEGPRLLGIDAEGAPPGDFALARDGVQVAWADSHGAALRWL